MSAPVAFWNVERLFDQNSHLRAAVEGVGSSAPEPAETTRKLSVLGAVIADFAASCGTPALLGVAEIQSPALVSDLADAIGLGLKSVEGVVPDEIGFKLEGLDISLLYDPAVFAPPTRIRSHVLDRTFDTRDILEVELTELTTGRSVLVLLSHWPSRLASEAAERRVNAAYYLRALVNERVRFQPQEMWDAAAARLRVPSKSDREARAQRPVVLMGDFNDQPFDPSIELLNSTPESDEVMDDLHVTGRSNEARYTSYLSSTPRIFNPFWSMCTAETGTYYRSPRWRVYDQLMLSRGALELFGGRTAYVHSPTHVNVGGIDVPLASRLGRPLSFDVARMQGASDHLLAALIDPRRP